MSDIYNLSIVNISQDRYVNEVNNFAASCGCGENSLSVKLQDKNNNIFWGCHSWWKPNDYNTYISLIVPEHMKEAFNSLYERNVFNGDAQENWQSALNELGLSII